MKYNVTTKFNMQVLTIKLQKHENIVENEVLWINSQRISNLIPVQVYNNGKDHLLNYNVNGFLSLKSYLKKKMFRSDVTVLLNSIIDCCKSIETNHLRFEKLLLEDKGIFINPVSKKCIFAYVPIDTYGNGLQKNIFLSKLLQQIHLEKKENSEMILHLKNIIVNPQFSWNELDDFVKHMADEDRKMIHDNKSMQNQQEQNNIKFCAKCGQKYIIGAKFCKKCGNSLINAESQNKEEAAQANSVLSTPPVAPMPSRVPVQPTSPVAPMPSRPSVQPTPPVTPMPSRPSVQPIPSEAPIISSPLQMDTQPHKSYDMLYSSPIDNDEAEDATTVLSQRLDETQEETTVLNMNQTPKIIYPYFVRECNGEEIYVNKNNFNLGKGKNSDYMLTGNSAISRNHATIITRENKYYIIDNQSTNYTYVNGIQVCANQEYEIKALDIIKMADEEFTMYVDE